MTGDAERKVLAEAEKRLRVDLETQEAKFLAHRIGLASIKYPHVIRETLWFLFRQSFDDLHAELAGLRKEIDSVKRDIEKVNDRVTAAAKLVHTIDVRTRPPAKRK